MPRDKRKHVRRLARYGARIMTIDGAELGLCLMIDVSASGARLVLQSTEQPPDEFRLVLSRNGRVHRHCGVVWHGKKMVGVRFTHPPFRDWGPRSPY